MKNYIYILREDFYLEWAWECGATNLICVSYDKETILKELEKVLKYELSEDNEIIFNNHDNITDTIKNISEDFDLHNEFSVDVYTNENNYENGMNYGTFIIEKMEVK